MVLPASGAPTIAVSPQRPTAVPKLSPWVPSVADKEAVSVHSPTRARRRLPCRCHRVAGGPEQARSASSATANPALGELRGLRLEERLLPRPRGPGSNEDMGGTGAEHAGLRRRRGSRSAGSLRRGTPRDRSASRRFRPGARPSVAAARDRRCGRRRRPRRYRLRPLPARRRREYPPTARPPRRTGRPRSGRQPRSSAGETTRRRSGRTRTPSPHPVHRERRPRRSHHEHVIFESDRGAESVGASGPRLVEPRFFVPRRARASEHEGGAGASCREAVRPRPRHRRTRPPLVRDRPASPAPTQ